jgi:hypothetical protein
MGVRVRIPLCVRLRYTASRIAFLGEFRSICVVVVTASGPHRFMCQWRSTIKLVLTGVRCKPSADRRTT